MFFQSMGVKSKLKDHFLQALGEAREFIMAGKEKYSSSAKDIVQRIANQRPPENVSKLSKVVVLEEGRKGCVFQRALLVDSMSGLSSDKETGEDESTEQVVRHEVSSSSDSEVVEDEPEKEER